MEAFGLTLKRFRMRQGITQEHLADLMGVSRNTIVNWETRKPPNREDVLHLARVLYLDEGEKDELLSAAGYSPTYQIRKPGRYDYYAHISLPRNYVEALVRGLQVDENKSCENVLQDYALEGLFAPPILLPETLSTIMSHIIEICEKWQWL